MSLHGLHGPAGACILVASASPIHVFPIQRVLKHCDAHKHTYIYIINIYIHTHMIQNNLRTPQLAGFACQLGCNKIVLDSTSAGRLEEPLRISSRHSRSYCRGLCSNMQESQLRCVELLFYAKCLFNENSSFTMHHLVLFNIYCNNIHKFT